MRFFRHLDKNYRYYNTKQAFTLLEMAIVLVIVGIIAGMSIYASQDMLDTANRVATERKLDAIEKALFTFWQKNGRLPCPADATLATTHANFGKEASNLGGACNGSVPKSNFQASSATHRYKSEEGAVPITTLGISREFMLDSWGKKIAYAVSPDFAYLNARQRISVKSSKCVGDKSIKIKDSSGGDRSISAVYALISYGKNGHGAYPGTGSARYNAGSTNSDELANCHCDSSAVNTTYYGDYIQRSSNFNQTTPANYFDDIVRYKERWQLVTDEDIASDDGYRGPDLAVAYVKVGDGTVYTYKNQCGAFIKQADLDPLPTNEVRGVAFTAGNKHLLTYSASGCNLYKINADGTLTNLPNAFDTACVYDSTAVMELSNNGYLAISSGTSSPTINLWKQAGDKFTALPSLTHTNNVLQLSFSYNANLLAVRSETTTSKIYKRKGDSFSAAAADITQPVNLASSGTPLSLVFSKDGKYLADYEWVTPNAAGYTKYWRVLDGSSFVQITSGASVPGSVFSMYFFPNDSSYLLMNLGGMKQSILSKNKFDDGVLFVNNLVSYNSFSTSNNPMTYSVDKKGNYIIVSKSNDAAIFELYKRRDLTMFWAFQPFVGSNYAVDQVLSGSTGGPVAFSN